MPFNINEFISNGLVLGGARPTLFEVYLNWPTGAFDIPTGVENRFRFTCRSSSIPASSIAPVEVYYFGRAVKVAGDRTFADWSVTVMNDEDFVVRNAFEAWHNNINTIVSNRRVLPDAPFAGYKASADVLQYGKDGNVIKSYKFTNLFPLAVEEMALDWESQNQIQTFGVTFAYDYYEPLVVNETPIVVDR